MKNQFIKSAQLYLQKLTDCFSNDLLEMVEEMANDLLKVWTNNKTVFICGNGGSAANAIHMSNDFHYGIGACGSPPQIPGIKVEALTANQGILTCLGNDIGYENIFSHQLYTKASEGDMLIVLSGSGNSPNIIKALEAAKELNMINYAILGFKGGDCKEKADKVIHFPIDDMQIAEDTQLIIGHICMQWLSENKPVK